MTKTVLAIATAVTLIFGLTACSSDYIMTTRSGEMIVTKGKPELDPATGMTKYIDQFGNEHQIRSEQIYELVEY